jgi:membrane associated rhomboid family serine protease
MTPTPVGMRCPECSQQRTKVVRGPGGASGFAQAPATYVLIALNVLVFLAEVASGSGGLSEATGSVVHDFSLLGNGVADGEWYRLLTGGFLHAGLIHIAFNMFALFIVGRVLEPGIGTPRFVTLYMASLLAGSFGALLLTHPSEPTVGASGAIFGLMAGVIVVARGRGVEQVAQQFGLFVVLNLVLTFSIPGISIGGHIGGLIGGAVAALLVIFVERRMSGRPAYTLEIAGILLMIAATFVGALAVASA